MWIYMGALIFDSHLYIGWVLGPESNRESVVLSCVSILGSFICRLRAGAKFEVLWNKCKVILLLFRMFRKFYLLAHTFLYNLYRLICLFLKLKIVIKSTLPLKEVMYHLILESFLNLPVLKDKTFVNIEHTAHVSYIWNLRNSQPGQLLGT